MAKHDQRAKQNQTFLDFKPIETKFDNALQSLTVKGVGGVSASKVGQKTLKMIVSQEDSMFSAAAKTAINSIFD